MSREVGIGTAEDDDSGQGSTIAIGIAIGIGFDNQEIVSFLTKQKDALCSACPVATRFSIAIAIPIAIARGVTGFCHDARFKDDSARKMFVFRTWSAKAVSSEDAGARRFTSHSLWTEVMDGTWIPSGRATPSTRA